VRSSELALSFAVGGWSHRLRPPHTTQRDDLKTGFTATGNEQGHWPKLKEDKFGGLSVLVSINNTPAGGGRLAKLSEGKLTGDYFAKDTHSVAINRSNPLYSMQPCALEPRGLSANGSHQTPS